MRAVGSSLRCCVVGVSIALGASGRLTGQAVVSTCSAPSAEVVRLADEGWLAMHSSQIAKADSDFRAALVRCPRYPSALVGAGYAAMRTGKDAAAVTNFDRALTVQPANYDALVGLGMLAYRRGDLSTSWRRFAAALAVVPGDSVSAWYLTRIPGALDSVRLPPRPRPAQMRVAARTGERIFEVPDTAGRWRPLWVKAVNLGAALPGKHP